MLIYVDIKEEIFYYLNMWQFGSFEASGDRKEICYVIIK